MLLMAGTLTDPTAQGTALLELSWAAAAGIW